MQLYTAERAQKSSVNGRKTEVIRCYLCPLKDVCTVPKLDSGIKDLPFVLNWLPDGSENMCPLYITVSKLGKVKK